MFSATSLNRLITFGLLAGCSAEVTSPPVVDAPAEAQKQSVSISITVATENPPDSLFAYTLFINNRSERLPHTGTIVFSGVPRAQIVLTLADVPRYCWVVAGPQRWVTPNPDGFIAVEYRVLCHKLAHLNAINLPAGSWRAVSYEFSLEPDFQKVHDDLIARGADGTLVVQATSGGGTNWLWTQTYRWWPGQREEYRGSTTFDAPIVNALLKSVDTPFECDWGRLHGPTVRLDTRRD